MKSLRIILFLFLFVDTASAQHYDFYEDQIPYTELENPTIIESPNFEDDNFTILPLQGETYHFFNVDFTFGGLSTFAIQTFGNLRIDDDTSAVIIDGIFTDLDLIDGTTTLSYIIEGSSGSQIVKAQWKNVALANGDEGNFVNFQIWVFQETGQIELRYGPVSENNLSGYTQNNGPYAGIFHSSDSFDDMYSKHWLFGHPDEIQTDLNQDFNFQRLLGIPQEGTVYRFVPTTLSGDGTEDGMNQSNTFSIYPNPVRTEIQIAGITDEIKSCKIMDIRGSLLEAYPNPSLISVANLPIGIYVLEIETSAQIIRKKFVKI